MSTLQHLTRAAVDAAEPLTFPSRRNAVVHLAYRGVAVDVALDGANAAEVEKLVDGLLGRDGWAAPAALGGNTPAPRPPAPAPARPTAAEPVYQPDGTACCPWHLRPLKEGRYGLFCPSRAEGEQANDKGYCRFTVRD